MFNLKVRVENGMPIILVLVAVPEEWLDEEYGEVATVTYDGIATTQ